MMKIQSGKLPLQSQSTSRSESNRASASADPSSSAQEVTAAKENVTLNPVAAKLGKSDQSGGDSSVFDSDRVASLRQAISEGRFTVNSDAIADKLISSVHELLSQ